MRRIPIWVSIGAVLTGCSRSDDAFWVRRDGADLPVWRQGPDDAETLVLMTHGSGASGRFYDWFEAFDTLEDEVAVVYWDMRGAGISQGNASLDSIALDDLLADLTLVRAAVEDRYSPQRLVLAGHSLGGGVTTGHLTDPANREGVAGYIDISGASHSERAFAEVRQIMTDTAEEAGRDDIVAFYADLDAVPKEPGPRLQHAEYVVEVNDLRGFDQAASDAELAAFIASRSAGGTLVQGFDVLGFLGNTQRFVGAFDFAQLQYTDEDVAGIDVPVLFVAGRYDLSVPPAFSERVFDAVQGPEGSAFLELEGGHWPMFDAPGEFSEGVLSFLGEL